MIFKHIINNIQTLVKNQLKNYIFNIYTKNENLKKNMGVFLLFLYYAINLKVIENFIFNIPIDLLSKDKIRTTLSNFS